ncbi:MAG: hypothetical protein A2719_01250 [Candidatus Ryanbacteria bacterium RIFCSPHIGHO2_01_FULL_45_22]|uniref:SHS2 domain-containing protein n=2 Tax=Candidatus Ryaniibacteriota TaxID=1817914 RepID=A0A1G2G1K4_9BACT|nr:MAG: hypothetical protein A2719_01250 [Candidatus Ryanbacteria bacterium RIFCSPHIGHO2_01_FULL_45_22]OGZ46354.1 MAG: hypothetical protein A3J54_04135 [Candidatus Ryanbacteria bacterium RIFCSPHIGHO2_02_FULL_45_13b]
MWLHRRGNIIQSIAFDCGTSAVRAALFSYPQKDVSAKPDVSQIINFPFMPATYMDAQELRQKTRIGIGQIIKKISSSFQPQEIILGLSAPFYISKTIHATRQRKQPHLFITEMEFQDLIAETKHTFEDDAKKRVTDGEIITFTALPQKTHINGYPVEKPVGMTGKIIETSFYFEATTQGVLNSLKEFFAHQYPHATFHVSSVALANFRSLCALYGNNPGFLIIDIGGEITEVTLTIEGMLEQVTPLPMGHMMLLRETAALLDVSLTDASFIINRYAEHTLESKQETKITSLVTEFQHMWRKKMLIVLTAFTEQYDVPPHILFTGYGVLPFHKDIFLEDAFRSIFYTKNQLIEFAKPEIFDRQFNKHPFRGTSDFGLASLTLLRTKTIV